MIFIQSAAGSGQAAVLANCSVSHCSARLLAGSELITAFCNKALMSKSHTMVAKGRGTTVHASCLVDNLCAVK